MNNGYGYGMNSGMNNMNSGMNYNNQMGNKIYNINSDFLTDIFQI